ncbi:DExH-box splicing factor binding site-domain-containing protein [Hypoxylon rubiginosum]|uniref:DExH-box splicing factor binding site-domain-containing protein n=1 Tax=Hypoxylon rubiginosum TaxID=110542 RepID=A0ACB9ZAR5_9PEZI|nr:DExH-box splicing factor binding site-domain-containing protein [Hypoxylon rubiginosum]
MPEPAPRIAIKFGAPSSSKPTNGIRKQTRPQPSSALGKRHRAHALGHDSDSGSDEEDGTAHEIVSIGGDWAESGTKRRNVSKDKSRAGNTPYVITGHKNSDWKAELKGQKRSRGVSPAKVNESAETDPADQDKQIKWGLTATKKPRQDDTKESNDAISKEQIPATTDADPIPRANGPGSKKAEDNDAMDALLGKKRKSAKDLVIQATSRHGTPATPSEQESYRRKMEEAAEISTIEEYDQIPEGEFGAAMLRGMGWNGEERGSKPKEAKKRAHLMGLGSKEDEEIRKGELARKHGHRERRPRLDEYRRNKEKERQDRENRHGDSYKSERERDRTRQDHGHSHSHSRRDRDGDRNGRGHHNRDYRR